MSGWIKNPARSILIAEMPSFFPYSWHQPRRVRNEWSDLLTFNDAQNVASFVDGHAGHTKIYWNKASASSGGYSFAMNYDPPDRYDYQWSGD